MDRAEEAVNQRAGPHRSEFRRATSRISPWWDPAVTMVSAVASPRHDRFLAGAHAAGTYHCIVIALFL